MGVEDEKKHSHLALTLPYPVGLQPEVFQSELVNFTLGTVQNNADGENPGSVDFCGDDV